MSGIKMTFPNGSVKEVPAGTTLEEISSMDGVLDSPSPVMAAMVNGKITELSVPMMESAQLVFLTLAHMDGYRIYQRSLLLLFLRSAREVLEPEASIYVKHSIGNGIYCEIEESERFRRDPQEAVRCIEARMRELVNKPERIQQMLLDLPDAMEKAKEMGLNARLRLFRYRRFSVVHMYQFGKYQDYLYGFMLPDSSRLGHFGLQTYEEGVVLLMPTRRYPHEVQPFRPMPKLFEIFQQSRDWSRILHAADIGALNEQISAGKLRELVYTSEALHAKHISNIAQEISSREKLQLVLIAGPSSSGKTTFARKLCIQLRAEGMVPHLISVDNYFKNREDTPLDEDGAPDFESLDALDCEQFQKDLEALLDGQEVNMPTYNFKTGRREYRGGTMKFGASDVLVVEGIHCLNEELTASIPREKKYKIYISALTQLGIDEHNRIPTTDGRLLRRIVRDHQFRGTSAAQTIRMWESVRRGEDRNIFPFQEQADVMFNSALPYEMAILKQFAEPLLFRIDQGTPEYAEARRLIKFLDYFQGVSSEEVPQISILREFIGGSVYEHME